MRSLIWVMLAWAAPLHAELVSGPTAQLYRTNFESFEGGGDTLAGTDGWQSSGGGQGLHGVDSPGASGVGKSAYIGRGQPLANTRFVSVWRAFDYAPLDPAEDRGEVVEFVALIGIADSTNGRRDNFYVSLYDSGSRLLSGVNFDNTQDRFGIYRYDGSNYHRSPVGFRRGQVHELAIRINFATGLWSAELDNLPVFRDEPIDFTNKTKTLGGIAMEWEIADAANPGNNWMLFDEWRVEAHSPPLPVPTVDPAGNSVSWQTESGYLYALERSRNLQLWEVVSEIGTGEPSGRKSEQLAGAEAPPSGSWFFRVRRSWPAEVGN